MKIEGFNFQNYDPRYLQVTQRLAPESVKPNLFKDVDESVARALMLTDAVSLSPEAKSLLKKLRKMGGNPTELLKNEKNIRKLIYTYRELRDTVYGEDEEEDEEGQEEDGKKKQKYFVPGAIQISGPELDDASRKKRRTSAIRDLLDKMIVHAPNPILKEGVKQELEVLGEKIVATCKQFGVRIIVLARNQVLSDLRLKGMTLVAPGERTFDGRPWDMVRGIYDPSRRIMVIGEENVGNPFRSTARHEFAHAFDHTFTSKNQRKLPLSVQLWNLFREERQGLVSEYAGTNPQEYFAECVEAYFRKDGREKLQKQDPKMSQYLEALFES